jgi:hypothetical protein
MHSALRFHPSRRAVTAARAAKDDRPHTLFWLAAFIILTSLLATLEIRSEALTVSALPRDSSRAGAAQPHFIGPVVATTVAVVGHDRE